MSEWLSGRVMVQYSVCRGSRLDDNTVFLEVEEKEYPKVPK